MERRDDRAAVERLEREAGALDSIALANPAVTATRASRLLMEAEVLLPLAPRHRLPLHRAAATTALILADSQRCTGRPFGHALGSAQAHARDAQDGPLAAQVLHLQALHTGEAAPAVGVSSPVCVRHLTRAIEVAGGGRDGARVRARVRFCLAWEHAAAGATTAGLRELQSAAVEWGVTGGEAALRRGDTLRLIPGRAADAERDLSIALMHPCPPVRKGAALASLAQAHVARSDIDAACAALEEAWLVNRQAGVRQWRVRAVRRGLPDTPAVRQLDALMYDGA